MATVSTAEEAPSLESGLSQGKEAPVQQVRAVETSLSLRRGQQTRGWEASVSQGPLLGSQT